MKSFLAIACTMSLLLAAAGQAQAQTVVRDHRGEDRQVRQPTRYYGYCNSRNHSHTPDGGCVSSWSQRPGAVIRDHRTRR